MNLYESSYQLKYGSILGCFNEFKNTKEIDAEYVEHIYNWHLKLEKEMEA